MDLHKLFYRRNMPHFQPSHKTYFITYRLFNSIPIPKVIEMSRRYHLIKNQNSPLPSELKKKLYREYFLEFDSQLEKESASPFWMQEDSIAQIVFDSLL